MFPLSWTLWKHTYKKPCYQSINSLNLQKSWRSKSESIFSCICHALYVLRCSTGANIRIKTSDQEVIFFFFAVNTPRVRSTYNVGFLLFYICWVREQEDQVVNIRTVGTFKKTSILRECRKNQHR